MKACRGTHLNPSLVSHVDSVVACFAASIDLLSLAWRRNFLCVYSGSLPVLHLDDRGRREKGGGRSGNRHERRLGIGGRNAVMIGNQKRWRVIDADMGYEYAPNPGDAPCRVVEMVIKQRLAGGRRGGQTLKGRRVFTT